MLGPHLLTQAAARRDRAIWVSSGGMYAQKLVADDLEYLKSDYKPARPPTRGPSACRSCSPRSGPSGVPGIVVQRLHPGWVDTPGIADSLPLFKKLTRPILRTPEQGADTFVWLVAAASRGRPPGRFWHDRAARAGALHAVSRASPTQDRRDALECGRG